VSIVSIIGAGPIGGSVAHRLAQHGRISAVRLIDSNGPLASGKALDIRQAGPVERFDTPISSSDDVLSAVGSPVIIIADDSANGPWDDERGLGLVQRLLRAGTTAALVFAAPSHVALMEKVYRELGVPADRLVGTASSAVIGATRALAGLELNAASVRLTLVGRPPALVAGWTAATADGSFLVDRVAAHRLSAISQALPKLWPPGPYAIGSATAEVVEALVCGSRRLIPAMTIIDGDLGVRATAVMLPLELGRHRVLSHIVPSLSPQERTAMMRGLV
jgi:malate dehydrogenase